MKNQTALWWAIAIIALAFIGFIAYLYIETDTFD